jgi:GH35 family endo-1,4-beta-xylanase
VLAVLELAGEPFTKAIREVVRLSPEWKEYRLYAYSPMAFAPGESQFSFFVGYDKARIELANVRVENFGRAPQTAFSPTVDHYGGVTPDDSWRAPALARIEKIRKGDLRVKVVDGAGRPVRNAAVTIEQQKHGFKWGTAGPAARLLDESPNSVRYRDELKKRFNTFVFESDMKWPQSPDITKLERLDRALAWLKANGISNVRGHNAVWGSEQYLPAGALDLPKDELTRRIQERTAAIVGRFKGQLYAWDVVNEAATNTALWDKIGWDQFVEVHKTARAADPNALLAYNDYNIVNEAPDGGKQKAKVYERIKYLIDNGAPLDIIGDQAHMGTPLTPIKRVLEVMDETARFGKRIEITEFDVSVKDDKVHGEYSRDFVIAAFSHPAVDAFLMWGFWEGQHWLAKQGGAMLRKDWSERPAAKSGTTCSSNSGGPRRMDRATRRAFTTRAPSTARSASRRAWVAKPCRRMLSWCAAGKQEWTLVLK